MSLSNPGVNDLWDLQKYGSWPSLNFGNSSFVVMATIGDVMVLCYGSYTSVPFVPFPLL